MSSDNRGALDGERGGSWWQASEEPHARMGNRLAILCTLLVLGGLIGSYGWRSAHGGPRPNPTAGADAPRSEAIDLPAPDFSKAGTPEINAAGSVDIVASGIPAALIGGSRLPAEEPLQTSAPDPGSQLPPRMNDRRLSGSAYIPASGGSSSAVAMRDPDDIGRNSSTPVAGAEPASPGRAIVAATAHFLPDPRMVLPRGAFIDCTLETAIDSSLPGMTTCVTATDTFGADGKVVLLERGSKVSGETRGQVQQGRARIYVVWTEARTPAGVIVPLESPAADSLGRAGLDGFVDRHFWQRFGAALLISTIDGGTQAAVQSMAHGGGTVVYGASGSEQVATEALKGTLDIPPTVRKDNGDRVQILVAHDIDFRPVYELRTANEGR